MTIILGCWYVNFLRWDNIPELIAFTNTNPQFWSITAISIFLTTPAGILVGKLTSRWREKIAAAESLANAGKWIGSIAIGAGLLTKI